MGHLYRFATRASAGPDSALPLKPLSERVAAAGLMREAGVKCGVFVGVPKVRTCHCSFKRLLMRIFRGYVMCGVRP